MQKKLQISYDCKKTFFVFIQLVIHISVEGEFLCKSKKILSETVPLGFGSTEP
jgi:hypothetical protein